MTKYRSELIEQIKATGQEIIDRAEQMVSEDTKLISDFSITCRFSQEEFPTVQWTTEVVNKGAFDCRRNK